MTDTVRYPLVLGLISLCSAAGLALTYSLTRDEIRRQGQLKKDRGLAEVFGIQLDPKAGGPPPWQTVQVPGPKGDGGYAIYKANDPETHEVLYAAEGSAQGYSSRVEVVVAVTENVASDPGRARIRAIKVVKQLETPGLGSKSTDPKFQWQFDDLPIPHLELEKNKPYRDLENPQNATQGVAAITGATITSTAVINGVRQAIDRIHKGIATDEPKKIP